MTIYDFVFTYCVFVFNFNKYINLSVTLFNINTKIVELETFFVIDWVLKVKYPARKERSVLIT